MPKLTLLTNEQLRGLLERYELVTNGKKQDLVERLKDHIGTDEIDSGTLKQLLPSTNVEDELKTMREMMESLMKTVENLGQRVNQRAQTPPQEIEEESSSNVTIELLAGEATHGPTDNAGFEDICYNEGTFHSTPRTSCHQVLAHGRYSVREIAETIPEYDPTNIEALSAEQFIKHVESSMEAYAWNEKSLLLAVYSRLKGVARMWYDGQNELFRTWHDFKTKLREELRLTYDEAEISAIMQKAVRLQGEPMVDYCFRIHSLGQRYKLSESATIRFARDGLRHRELQTAIATQKFTTMKQLRETIMEYKANIPTSSYYSRERSEQRFKNSLNQNIKRNQTVIPGNKDNIIKCYNCNESGHISRDCSKRPRKERCTICNRTSHKTQDCFGQQQIKSRTSTN